MARSPAPPYTKPKPLQSKASFSGIVGQAS